MPTKPAPHPPKPRWTDPEGRPTVRWNQVRWRTKRAPLSDSQLQQRYHRPKGFTGALHPSVYPNLPNYSGSTPDGCDNPPPRQPRLPLEQPSAPCSQFRAGQGYRRFYDSLPQGSSLPRLPPAAKSTTADSELLPPSSSVPTRSVGSTPPSVGEMFPPPNTQQQQGGIGHWLLLAVASPLVPP